MPAIWETWDSEIPGGQRKIPRENSNPQVFLPGKSIDEAGNSLKSQSRYMTSSLKQQQHQNQGTAGVAGEGQVAGYGEA